MKPLPELYDTWVEREAEKSINRNMYELREADARVRQYKAGANSVKPLIMELVKYIDQNLLASKNLANWIEANQFENDEGDG